MKFSPPILSCSIENFCFHVGDYSFGFSGKDKESEFNSGAYDFGARIHDARLGRWMSVDGLSAINSNYSVYCTIDNSPISKIDPNGEDALVSIEGDVITIKAQICISGSGATNEKAAEMQKQIMQTWGKDFTYNDGTKEYKVKFAVEVINTEISTGGDPTMGKDVDPLRWDGDENWVVLQDESKEEYRSNVSGETGNDGKWGADDVGRTYAHEFGHLLGLADKYVDIKYSPEAAEAFGIPLEMRNKVWSEKLASASDDELMAKGNNVTKSDVSALAKGALEIYRNGGSKLEARGMPYNRPTELDLMPYSGGHYIIVQGE